MPARAAARSVCLPVPLDESLDIRTRHGPVRNSVEVEEICHPQLCRRPVIGGSFAVNREIVFEKFALDDRVTVPEADRAA
jgi:hypothetical protein